MMMPMIIFGRY